MHCIVSLIHLSWYAREQNGFHITQRHLYWIDREAIPRAQQQRGGGAMRIGRSLSDNTGVLKSVHRSLHFKLSRALIPTAFFFQVAGD